MKKFTSSFFLLMMIVIGLTSCENHGNKVSKDFVEVYYRDGISKEQAQQTLELLHPGWNDSGNKKSVQLAKTGDTVYFRMVIDDVKAKDIKDQTYLLMANEISNSVFKGSPVNVDLTTTTFKTIRTLSFKKMETAYYGTKTSSGNIEVYYKDGISTEEEAKALAEFLDRLDGDTDVVKSFQVSKDNDLYIVNMVSDPEQSGALPDKEFYDLAGLISDSVFDEAPLILHLTDNRFNPYKTFRYSKKKE